MQDTIYGQFAQSAQIHADEPAIIENRRTLTYAELSDLVNTIAGGFPDSVRSVGVIMKHRAEMIAAILAVLKCGAMYVPAEPSFPIGRIRYMMEEADVDFILTDMEFMDRLNGLSARIVDCEICKREATKPDFPGRADAHSPAYVLYTSGTTGRPKGVCVTNANVCHYARAFEHEFHAGAGDVMLQNSVCSFDIFVEEVFGALLNGAALAIPSAEDQENVESLMAFADRHHVTILSGFPYLLAEMNHLHEIPSSLRLLISGGDVLREVYVDNLLDKAQVYNTYGPSETTVCASYYRCNNGRVLEDGSYPIGRPILGARIQILNSDGEEAPPGSVGEICIWGDGVSCGYIGDHDEENLAFEHSADDNVMYRSGDLGYMLPDGNIAFLHRKDTQIMIFGKRVEVMEVESRLYQCRGVAQAVVRPFTDESGLSYMAAYVVASDENLSVSGIVKELSENLPPYMIPEFFVKMSHIPLNVNGKPDVSKFPVVVKNPACRLWRLKRGLWKETSAKPRLTES